MTALAAALLPALWSPAADWPMVRADAGRTGYTPEALPEGRLSLLWTRVPRHAPRPAWPNRPRMQFDRALQPVVAAGTLYLASSADDQVRAVDAATGRTRWAFFTDAPVRFAPAVWDGRVFVAGDDGRLYCLAANTGGLLWCLRAGPRDDRLLGNDRMISRWPARGGPAVADGMVYFGAGIWPSEGIFIYAVRAESGKVVWCNDSSGGIEIDQPRVGSRAKSGPAAHGYVAVGGDVVLVPTGRAVPAAFDRAGGQLRYFHLASNKQDGGSRIAVIDGLCFHRGNYPSVGGRAFDTAEGAQCGGLRGLGPLVAAHPKMIVAAQGDRLIGLDRARPVIERDGVDRKGGEVRRRVLAPPVWEARAAHPVDGEIAVAGDRIVAGGGGKVSLIDVGSKATVWQADVDGIACGLAVSDGRLFVSTDRGTVHCFGAGGKVAAVVGPEPAAAPDGAASVYVTAAREIIERAGVTRGYCLELACGDGRLALELARRTGLRIYAVEADVARVRASREMFDAAGLYGVRVTVHQADPARVPYLEGFADLVVSGRSVTEGASAVPPAAVRRMVRPDGGVACLGKPKAMRQWVRGPLAGAGSWTHQYADAGNTLCCVDRIVRGPLRMRWFRDTDIVMPSRHGMAPAPLVHDGRMLIEGVNGVRAVNAYNGQTLWEFPIPGILASYSVGFVPGGRATGSNMCLSGGRLYVRYADTCVCLDTAEGKKLAQCEAPRLPDGKRGTWGYIGCDGGVLVGSLANERHHVRGYSDEFALSRHYSESQLLFGLDAVTGELKWTHKPQDSIRHNAIALGGGRVFLIDRPVAASDAQGFDRDKAIESRAKALAEANGTRWRDEYRKLVVHPLGRLRALDARTGAVLWQTGRDAFGTMLALSVKHDVLLMCYQNNYLMFSDNGGRMAAFRAGTGQVLWDKALRYGSRPILNDRTIFSEGAAYDLLTGDPLPFEFRRAHGCGPLTGSTRLLVFRSGTLGYYDLGGTKRTENYGGIRSGCWINAIPAGGLVLMADGAHGCGCSYLNQATIALEPSPQPAP